MATSLLKTSNNFNESNISPFDKLRVTEEIEYFILVVELNGFG
ncbi:MAG TPA: hypothetical protein PKA80_02960 [Ignavibacteriaceae bacterium]|nr:hypothetical protein [Ignavibacteriaceae bacterium]